jgi:hypothetical protein
LAELAIIAALLHQPVEMSDRARKVSAHCVLKKDPRYVVIAQVQNELRFGPGFLDIAFR